MKFDGLNIITVSAWFSTALSWFFDNGLTTIATVMTIVLTGFAIYNYYLKNKKLRIEIEQAKGEKLV